ncbi:MAG: PIN domain-containing protein [Acidobacteria bacterium]|nr:PIN domain-containing protein [Acidobacteriota bacterium]
MAGDTDQVLLDTSVWIDALRGRTPAVVACVQRLLNDDRVATCGPVIYEIHRGLRSGERDEVLSLFRALHRITFEESDWEDAGTLDASLRSRGRSLPPMEVLLACLCLRHKVKLFSLDVHFTQVPGIVLYHEGTGARSVRPDK